MLKLVLLQCCPVVGVYNETDGKWKDLAQCLMDKAALIGTMNPIKIDLGLDFWAWSGSCDALYQMTRKARVDWQVR